MSLVTFKFDKNKDLWNIWATCNHVSSWSDYKGVVNPRVLRIAENREFEECRDELEKYFERIHDSEIIQIFIDSINKSWQTVDEEFVRRMEKVTKKPLCLKHFTGYVTTMGRCPYNILEGWFMVCFFGNILNAMSTTAHEILHFQFHHYYWNYVEGEIGKSETADLKEALTVLLNLEFKDLWHVKDKGYEKHKKLRSFIEGEWKISPDFDILLKSCIDYLKNNKV